MRKTKRLAIIILMAFIFNLFTPTFNAKADTNPNLDMLLTLENPTQNHKLTDSFFIKGWSLSENGISKVEVYLDNQSMGQATYGAERTDIKSKYPQYKDSLNSGFTKEVSGISDGVHTLKIVSIDNKGVTKETSVTINTNSSKNVIMGNGKATKEQMVSLLSKKNPDKTLSYIVDFANITIEEAKLEGVNADILFAQMMHETGYLKFGGDVKEEQNNFAGLGAVGNGAPGESFPSIRIGIRAVAQHLKAYASTEPLKLECVDTRFKYVQRGSANYVEHLGVKENPKGKGWAVHQGYGYYLLSIVDQLQSEQGKYSVNMSNFNVEGEFITGQPINLSATSNLPSDTLYKFGYRDDSTGEWIVIQDYNTNNKVTFTPNKAGSYRFVVHVKHKKSLEAYDDFGFEDKNVAGKGKVTNLDVTGNIVSGSTINVSAKGEPADVLYKFAVRDSSGEWKTIQDYSENNNVNYKVSSSGDLRVVVHVKHKLSNKAYDDYDFKDFHVKYSTVTLDEFNVTGANVVGRDILMKVKANPQNEALYKFAIRNPKGEWITVQDYSSKDNFVYVPKEPGEYRLVVHIKSKSSSAAYDDYDFKDIKIVEKKSGLKEFTVNGGNLIGSQINLSALADPSGNSLYKFAVRDPKGNWITIKEYSKISKFQYTPNEPGEYRFVVHVKHEESMNAYDEFDLKDISINYKESKLNEFNVSGNKYVDFNLTFSAKATPSDSTLYKFAIRTPDGTWKTMQDYSNKNTLNFTPKEEGNYRIVVHAKHKGSFNDYDDYRFEDISVSKTEVKANSFLVNGDLKPNENLVLVGTTNKPSESLYKFAIRTPDGTWTTIQDYSEKNSVNYVPVDNGEYRFLVHVKHKLSSKEYDDFYFRDLIVRDAKLIVIDPGHNHGGDDGAYATHGSKTYIERDLNMEVSVKLKKELEKRGFNVVMTRNPEDRDYTAMRQSLQNRVNLANNLNADFFISIHHNSAGIPPNSANGVEIYYSTAEPLTRGLISTDGKEMGLYGPISGMGVTNSKIEMSKTIGTSMVNAIASGMGRENRGLKDDDFYVVKNTWMPSLLVECGFITNSYEASLLADSNKQQQMAEIIARVIDSNL